MCATAIYFRSKTRFQFLSFMHNFYNLTMFSSYYEQEYIEFSVNKCPWNKITFFFIPDK